MGKREGEEIDVTVAAAMVDEYIPNMDGYVEAVESVREFVDGVAREHTDRAVNVHVNTADNYEGGLDLPHRHRHLCRAGRRRLRGPGQSRERTHHTQPLDVDGSDQREEPGQPHREDLQPALDADRRGGRQ